MKGSDRNKFPPRFRRRGRYRTRPLRWRRLLHLLRTTILYRRNRLKMSTMNLASFFILGGLRANGRVKLSHRATPGMYSPPRWRRLLRLLRLLRTILSPFSDFRQDISFCQGTEKIQVLLHTLDTTTATSTIAQKSQTRYITTSLTSRSSFGFSTDHYLLYILLLFLFLIDFRRPPR